MNLNPLDDIMKLLQYPQSVATGLAAMAPGMMGEGRKTSGDFSKLAEGLRGGYRPSTMMRENGLDDGSVMASIGKTGSDVMYDPMLLSSGLGLGEKAAGLSPKLAQIIEGAGTFGKMGEGASVAGKAGQFGRRYYQGLLATGDPLSAIGAGSIIGTGENAVSRLAPAIARKLGKEAVAQGETEAERLLKGSNFEQQTLFDPDTLGAQGDTLFDVGPGTIPVSGGPMVSPPPVRPPSGPLALEAGPASGIGQQAIPLPEQTPEIEQILELLSGTPKNSLGPGPRIGNLGSRPGPEMGTSTVAEGLTGLLGRRGDQAMAGGERLDELARLLLNRQTAPVDLQGRKVLEAFLSDPDPVSAMLRRNYGS